jgi:hypothetical protein
MIIKFFRVKQSVSRALNLDKLIQREITASTRL